MSSSAKETRRRITVRDSAQGEGVVQPEIGGVFKPVVSSFVPVKAYMPRVGLTGARL